MTEEELQQNDSLFDDLQGFNVEVVLKVRVVGQQVDDVRQNVIRQNGEHFC